MPENQTGNKRATTGARKKTDNIELEGLSSLSWKTPEETEKSLNALYSYAEDRASRSVAWYWSNKTPKARFSRWLRLAAILLGTLGGLAPIITSLGWLGAERNLWIGQAGYLLLGLAAACVALDKYFGFSSGWMRYIKTAQIISKAISEFRMDWAMMVAKLGGTSPTSDQTQQMIQRIKEFIVAIDGFVEQETQAWIAEFQTSLADIEKSVKVQTEASKPGVIDISVTNGMETESGFTVSLDGMAVKTVQGTKYQISYVPPGAHKITVKGTVKGKSLEASEVVNVPAGAVAQLTLALPVEKAQP